MAPSQLNSTSDATSQPTNQENKLKLNLQMIILLTEYWEQDFTSVADEKT
ncbi:hypothetical protein HanIR_Chr11g0514021 [Helianthus annuus]|nr:hypothetical protein HanIR_Chr11g0514021 [Helianthus annuus]